LPDGQISAQFFALLLRKLPSMSANHLREKLNFANPFNLIWPVQSCAQKHFAFHQAQIGGLSRHPGLATRGVSRSSRHVRRDAVDASARETSAAGADGEVVWS